MPRNTGERPPTTEPIDLELRNGRIIRNTTADKWRWAEWPEFGPTPFDVVRWQPSNGG